MKNMNDINDWLDVQEHQKIGEILIQCGSINLIQLGMALDIQRFKYIPLGEILFNMKVISQSDIEMVLSLQKQIDESIDKKKE